MAPGCSSSRQVASFDGYFSICSRCHAARSERSSRAVSPERRAGADPQRHEAPQAKTQTHKLTHRTKLPDLPVEDCIHDVRFFDHQRHKPAKPARLTDLMPPFLANQRPRWSEEAQRSARWWASASLGRARPLTSVGLSTADRSYAAVGDLQNEACACW